MTTYQELLRRRAEINSIVSKHKGQRPRVFGSVARGTQGSGSDVDLLVDVEPGATMLDLVRMQDELGARLGATFDVNIPRGLPKRWRESALSEALEI